MSDDRRRAHRPLASGRRYLLGALLVAVGALAIALAAVAPARAALPGGNGLVAFASDDGTITTLDPASGALAPVTTGGHDPAWSPEGTEIAFARRVGRGFDIFVANADGSALRDLTNAPSDVQGSPAWSPDGRRLAFSRRDGIAVINVDGTGLRTIATGPADHPAWSPDGGTLAYSALEGTRIFLVDPDDPGSPPRPLLGTDPPTTGDYPAWSPDGRTIAFTGTTCPDAQGGSSAGVCVVRADGTGLRLLVPSAMGAAKPAWSPDGSKIAYQAIDWEGPDWIQIANADGSGTRPVAQGNGPDWQPTALPPASLGLSQTSALAGSPGLALTVTGVNFHRRSVVRWNGADRPTTFESPTELTAQIPASDLARAGIVAVSVFTSAPGGGASTPVSFAVLKPFVNPAPRLTSVSPGSAEAGSPGLSLVLRGSGFVSSTVAEWKGQPRPTTLVSSTQVRVQIPAGDLRFPGAAGVRAVNPAPGGGSSNTLSFSVTPIPTLPRLNGVSPRAAFPGGLLTLTGAGFGSPSAKSFVTVRGERAATLGWDDSRITVYVPNLTPGPAAVTVQVNRARLGPESVDIKAPPPQAPIANAVVIPTGGADVLIDGSLSLSPDQSAFARPSAGPSELSYLRAGITKVVMKFGDGNSYSSTDPSRFSAEHTYPRPGRYRVSVTAWDRKGRSNTTSQSVRVSSPSSGVTAPAAVPEVNIRIPSQVVFDFGSAALRPESRAFLRRVARLLHHATTRVRVAGYTDNVGTPAFNRRLSLRRAQAVRRFLIHPGGVRVRLLRAVGFGEAHPLASNATELGRQRNRRVIISFHLASTYGFRL